MTSSLLLQTPRARVRRLVRRLRRDDSSPLAGRVVLVTGASSGIGEATARAAAARGATVLLVAAEARGAGTGPRGDRGGAAASAGRRRTPAT